MNMYPSFNCFTLDPKHVLWQGEVTDSLALRDTAFDALWELRPTDFRTIRSREKSAKSLPWSQDFLKSYESSGEQAAPSDLIAPYLKWAQTNIDPRLNGLHVEWYDSRHGHCVTKHRDNTAGLVKGAPIATIYLGESHVFRLRPCQKSGMRDFRADHGTAFILPYTTNLAWTHEVPATRPTSGRCVSITLRAFSGVPSEGLSSKSIATNPRSMALSL